MREGSTLSHQCSLAGIGCAGITTSLSLAASSCQAESSTQTPREGAWALWLQCSGHVGFQPLPAQPARQPGLPPRHQPGTGASALRLGGGFSAQGGVGGWERPQLAEPHEAFWGCLSKPVLFCLLRHGAGFDASGELSISAAACCSAGGVATGLPASHGQRERGQAEG